jgi:hypothetical protein
MIKKYWPVIIAALFVACSGAAKKNTETDHCFKTRIQQPAELANKIEDYGRIVYSHKNSTDVIDVIIEQGEKKVILQYNPEERVVDLSYLESIVDDMRDSNSVTYKLLKNGELEISINGEKYYFTEPSDITNIEALENIIRYAVTEQISNEMIRKIAQSTDYSIVRQQKERLGEWARCEKLSYQDVAIMSYSMSMTALQNSDFKEKDREQAGTEALRICDNYLNRLLGNPDPAMSNEDILEQMHEWNKYKKEATTQLAGIKEP